MSNATNGRIALVDSPSTRRISTRLLLACAIGSTTIASTEAFAQIDFQPVAALNSNASTDAGDDITPMIANDHAGNWIAVWYSEEDLGGTIGTDQDILVSRSNDAGATWTAPQALNTNAATDAGADADPHVSTDGAGNWVAVWRSADTLGGTLGTDFDILVARSGDGGVSWSAPAAIDAGAGSDSGSEYSQRVTTDGSGNWIAVWSASDTGGPLGADTDLMAARSTDAGASWSAASALNTNANADQGSDIEADIVSDGAGNWLAVWHSGDTLGGTIGTDLDILVARSSDAGVSWTAPVPLASNAATDSGNDARARAAIDGAGNWVVVWYSNENLGGTLGTDFDLLVSRSSDLGTTWTTPAALNTNAASDAGGDDRPELAFDGAGNFVAVWWSNENLGGSIGTDRDVFLSRSNDAGVTWSPSLVVNDNAATDSENDAFPTLATDRAGNWVVAWYGRDTLGETIGSDLDILLATGVGPDSDGDGYSDGAEVTVHGTDPQNPDTDGDDVCDGGISVPPCLAAGPDNCPFVVNFTQTNSDAFSAGDACQCGDANLDNVVSVLDLTIVRESVVGATLSGSLDPDRCNFTGGVGCDVRDVMLLERMVRGLGPVGVNGCTAFGAP